MNSSAPPLRIFYLEDNPLIVFHIEAIIEDLGHVFAGSANSFAKLVGNFDAIDVDGVLVDIDLADGRTGPVAAKWLRDRGIPSVFVTGQEAIAAEYPETALATIGKPVSVTELAEKLELFRRTKATSKTT
ncbi:response regulator receiver domain-containing protein [Sinorhizobium medicae]|uniref:response regulator n=1 Tax=Sinorhizobium medicae TaxID=110321 RepID=UPI0011A04BEE|nr:response regulator [Sinorhizobium medicae]TWA12517.1 response regulator receiver domain-containing protein [Sinorhizobium medicae]